METIPITSGHIAAPVRHYVAAPAAVLQASDIVRAVSNHFGVAFDELMGRKRTATVILARQVAMFLAYEMTGSSFHDLGTFFQRDHSSIINAKQAIEGFLGYDRKLNRSIAAIKESLKLPAVRVVT